jgi:ATP-dependent RNA helicase DDX46/PRP5
LIFVDRQESADSLLRDLMKKGYPCMSIHGGKDQIDRDSTIEDFKAGVVPILVATSVAARGLDVKQLKLVVNFDAPNHLEDYVHRSGRTGRAGCKGTAVTFLTDEQDRYAVDIAKALRQSGQPVPEPVQNLVDTFMEKVKAGKEKASNSGFGGKGLEKLDQERDAAKARERKTFKTGEEGDEDEKEEKDTTGDDLFAKAASGVKAFDTTPAQIPGVPKGIDLDGKITVHKTEREDRVRAAVQGINERLSKAGVMRQGVPIDNKGPDAGAFHATLEINDFPRKYSLHYQRHFILTDADHFVMQKKHAGLLRTGQMSRRSLKLQAHRSQPRAHSTRLARSRVQVRIRSCTFSSKATLRWWCMMR